MGDVSAEPSMEDILSSIKRIIAEEGEPAGPGRTTRRSRPAGLTGDVIRPSQPEPDEALEPRNDMSTHDPDDQQVAALPPPAADSAQSPAEAPVARRSAAEEAPPAPPTNDPLVSPKAVEASRGALDALSRMMVKPESHATETLEGLVREMLRPMLREWLDSHLPQIVESMVEQEVARISGRRS